MAQATVTLKVTPHELQTIKESLRMYAHVMGRDDGPLEGYRHNMDICEGQPRRAVMAANAIIKDIGLK